jgi:hypothetical protein
VVVEEREKINIGERKGKYTPLVVEEREKGNMHCW